MDARMLDGNAIAGLLREVFAVEMTTAIVTCERCSATDAVGAIPVFRGAGIVLRCRTCNTALMTIVRNGTRVWMSVSGVRTLEVALESPPSTAPH
jgi:hypothetical protein